MMDVDGPAVPERSPHQEVVSPRKRPRDASSALVASPAKRRKLSSSPAAVSSASLARPLNPDCHFPWDSGYLATSSLRNEMTDLFGGDEEMEPYAVEEPSSEEKGEFQSWLDLKEGDASPLSGVRSSLPFVPSAVAHVLAYLLDRGTRLPLPLLGKLACRLLCHRLCREDEERYRVRFRLSHFLSLWMQTKTQEELGTRNRLRAAASHLAKCPCVRAGNALVGLPSRADLMGRRSRRDDFGTIEFGDSESFAAPSDHRTDDGVLPIARGLYCALVRPKHRLLESLLAGVEPSLSRRLVMEGCCRAAKALEKKIFDSERSNYESYVKILSHVFENDINNELAQKTWLAFNPAFRDESCVGGGGGETSLRFFRDHYFKNHNVSVLDEILADPHFRQKKKVRGRDVFQCGACENRQTRHALVCERGVVLAKVVCLVCRNRFQVGAEMPK